MESETGVVIDTGDAELKLGSNNSAAEEVKIDRPGETDIVIDTAEDNFDAAVAPFPQTASDANPPASFVISKPDDYVAPSADRQNANKKYDDNGEEEVVVRKKKKHHEGDDKKPSATTAASEEKKKKKSSSTTTSARAKRQSSPASSPTHKMRDETVGEPTNVREYMESNHDLAGEFYRTVPTASGMPSTSEAYRSATHLVDTGIDKKSQEEEKGVGSDDGKSDQEEEEEEESSHHRSRGEYEKWSEDGEKKGDDDEEEEEEDEAGDDDKKRDDDVDYTDEESGQSDGKEDRSEKTDESQQPKKSKKADEYIEKMRLIEEIKQLSRAGAVPPQQPSMNMPLDMLRKIKEYQESVVDEIMGVGFIGMAWASLIGMIENLNERFDPFAKAFGVGLKLRGVKKVVDENIHLYESAFKHIYRKLGISKNKEVSPWLQLVLVTVQIFGRVHVQNLEKEMSEQAESMANNPQTRLDAEQMGRMYEEQRRRQQEANGRPRQRKSWGGGSGGGDAAASKPSSSSDGRAEVEVGGTGKGPDAAKQQSENAPTKLNKGLTAMMSEGGGGEQHPDQITIKPVTETVPDASKSAASNFEPSVTIDMVQPEEKIVVKPHSRSFDEEEEEEEEELVGDEDDDDDVIVQIPKVTSGGRRKKK